MKKRAAIGRSECVAATCDACLASRGDDGDRDLKPNLELICDSVEVRMDLCAWTVIDFSVSSPAQRQIQSPSSAPGCHSLAIYSTIDSADGRKNTFTPSAPRCLSPSDNGLSCATSRDGRSSPPPIDPSLWCFDSSTAILTSTFRK